MVSYWLIILSFSYVLGTHKLNEKELVAILVLLGEEIVKNPSQHPITLLTNVHDHDATDGKLGLDQVQQAVSTACGRQLEGYDTETISFVRTGCQLFEQLASTFLITIGKKLHGNGAMDIGRLAGISVYYEDKKRYGYRHVKEIVPLVCEKAAKRQFQSTVAADDHYFVSKACSHLETLAIEYMAGFYSEADFENDVNPWHLQQRNGVRREDSNLRITYDQVKGMIASFCAGQLPRSNEQSEITSRMCNFFEVQFFKIVQLIERVLKQTRGEKGQYGLIEESGNKLPFNFRHARMIIVKQCVKPYIRKQLAYAQPCDYLLKKHIELMLAPV